MMTTSEWMILVKQYGFEKAKTAFSKNLSTIEEVVKYLEDPVEQFSDELQNVITKGANNYARSSIKKT